jgi:hypothetical protein
MSRIQLPIVLTAALVLVGAGSTTAFAQTNPSAAESARWANNPCRDPWVTLAVSNAKVGARPSGSGDLGECDPALYNNGQWGSFAELTAAVRASLSTFSSLGLAVDVRDNQSVLRVENASAARLLTSDGASLRTGDMLIGHDGASLRGVDRHVAAAGDFMLRLPNGKLLVLRRK